MSASMVICDNLIFTSGNSRPCQVSISRSTCFKLAVRLSGCSRRKVRGVVPNAEKSNSSHSRKRKWWQKFFFDEDGNWMGLKEGDLLDEEMELSSNEEGLSEDEKFEAWRRRAEAIIELREAQEDMRNEESQRWEDWLVDGTNHINASSWDDNLRNNLGESEKFDPDDIFTERGIVKSVRDMFLGREDDDMLYEDRVFQYASLNSAKFLAVLLLVPWTLDVLVHDYALMPFLDRYVKTVPLAAELLDVRRPQKLEIVKELKVERARLKLEMEIGKCPPLSDDEVWSELRHKALELREDWRLENRKAFANIWSDMVFGVSLFAVLFFNQNKVALLKFTGYKIINNISDTGKAFLIILITDIFLGYHSESGWQTLVEVLVEHYGFEIDQSAIIIFVCIIPVIIDACVKLWLFKFLPRLSPKVSNIFQEMKRH